MAKRIAFPTRLLLGTALVLGVTACGDRPTVTQVPPPSVPKAAVPEIIDLGTEVILDMDLQESLGPVAQTGFAIFRQSAFETSSGTGQVQPFLKTNTNDTEFNAFNTSGDKPATVTSNDFTRDLPLSWVPTVSINNVVYREFRLDLNEPNNGVDNLLSLDRFELWVSPQDEIGELGNTGTPNFANSGASKRYEFPTNVTTWMRMDATLSSGSGGGDVFFYIPESAFGADGVECPYDGAVGTGCGKFVYLVVRFGDHETQEGTFEEFGVRRLPYVTKTAAYKYDEAVTWTIAKKVKKSTDASFTGSSVTFDLWNGDNATANYQVVVDKTVTKTNNRVEGVITIHNQTDGAFSVSNVTDTFEGTTVNVTCPSATVAKNSTLDCPYVVNLQSAPVLTPTKFNTASATLTSGNLTLTLQGKAPVNGPGELGSTTGFQTVHVTDNFNGGGAVAIAGSPISDDATLTPSNKVFTCATDKGTKTNVATITETGQTAQASVTTNCYSLNVTKTATPAQGDVFDWTITKGVTPASRTMYTGDQGEFQYAVNYTKGAPVSTRTVSGTVTVENPSSSSGSIIVAQPTDQVIADANNPQAINVSLTCPGGAFPRTLTAGASFQCTYGNVALPNGNSRTNRASAQGTIPTNNNKTFTGDAPIGFGNVVPSTTNNAVSISDPNDPSSPRGPFTASGSFNYISTHACGTTRTVNNTANMTSADGLNKNSNEVTITITCVAPTVVKTAATSYTRTWQWDIEKTRGEINGQPAPASLILQPGQSFVYPFNVHVFTTGHTNSAAEAHGDITVTGAAGVAGARSLTVSDALSGGFTPPVTCPGGNNPISITGNAAVTCTWSKNDLGSDINNRTNVATATLQNVKYQIVGGPSNLGTTPFSSSTVNVTFGAPSTLVDNCVKVVDVAQHKDAQGGGLGSLITNQLTNSNFSICVSGSPGAADQTIGYTTTIGPMDQFAACGNFRFDNTATLTKNTSGGTDDSSLQTPISVDCPQGCTLTQGYWKTHNPFFGADKKGGRKGPPVHDWSAAPAWSPWHTWSFFGGTPSPVPTGKTAVPLPDVANGNEVSWFANFQTAPKGNPYYQASHQFMAAALNVANGAPLGPIDTELGNAYTFFLTANPSTDWSDTQSAQLLAWNSLFGSYNEGKLASLHCSEDATSSTAP